MLGRALNIRGTNGTGKTTLIRRFMKDNPGWEPDLWLPMKRNDKILSYTWTPDLESPFRRKYVILGSYEATCGGCDTIPNVRIVASLLHHYMQQPNTMILYEGLMISHMLGTVGRAVKPYGDRHLMLFLDTPLETCIKRVLERRRARGDTREFDTSNVTKDHHAVELCKANATRQGYNLDTIDHKDAYNELNLRLGELLVQPDADLPLVSLDQCERVYQVKEGTRFFEAVD